MSHCISSVRTQWESSICYSVLTDDQSLEAKLLNRFLNLPTQNYFSPAMCKGHVSTSPVAQSQLHKMRTSFNNSLCLNAGDITMNINMWNINILGLGFMLIFSAFSAASFMESIVFKDYKKHGIGIETGFHSLATIYGFLGVSNWFAPAVVGKLGELLASFHSLILLVLSKSTFLHLQIVSTLSNITVVFNPIPLSPLPCHFLSPTSLPLLFPITDTFN